MWSAREKEESVLEYAIGGNGVVDSTDFNTPT
jgi:hypothetical protein